MFCSGSSSVKVYYGLPSAIHTVSAAQWTTIPSPFLLLLYYYMVPFPRSYTLVTLKQIFTVHVMSLLLSHLICISLCNSLSMNLLWFCFFNSAFMEPLLITVQSHFVLRSSFFPRNHRFCHHRQFISNE